MDLFFSAAVGAEQLDDIFNAALVMLEREVVLLGRPDVPFGVLWLSDYSLF